MRQKIITFRVDHMGVPELTEWIKKNIIGFYEDNSAAPSVRGSASAMGIAKSTACRHLVEMAERDMVSYEDGIFFGED